MSSNLGVKDHAAIVQWSGVAYGATFLTAAMFAPLWGRLGDRYGRKLMLIRASLGMALAMSLIGLSQNVYQLVGLRLLAGLLGGYSSGSTVLVATQTPRDRTGWALGVLSSGIMAGNLAGPLIGGVLPPLIGIRRHVLCCRRDDLPRFSGDDVSDQGEAAADQGTAGEATWRLGRHPRQAAGGGDAGDGHDADVREHVDRADHHGLCRADRSGPAQVTMIAGIVMSAAALGSILSASCLGKLADRVGHWNVIIGCLLAAAVLLIPQAFVTTGWQLIGLRFLMGLALGGLLPCVAAVIRHSVPEGTAGGILGYSTSSQYVGQVAGPLAGGFVGGHFGMRAVFLGTSVLMGAAALYGWMSKPRADNRVDTV